MVSREASDTPDDPERPEPDYHIGERLTGGLEDYVDMSPAKAKDSLKYACMETGFRHRPVPRGSTKRKAYCSACGATSCIYHPDMAPGQVMKLVQMPTKYPARDVRDWARSERVLEVK